MLAFFCRELIRMLAKLGEDEHTGAAPVATPVIIVKEVDVYR